MKNLKIEIKAKDISAARGECLTKKDLDTVLTYALDRVPGISLAQAGAPTGGLVVSGLELIRKEMHKGEWMLIRNMLVDKINAQLAAQKKITWGAYRENGVDYTVGNAPGKLRYFISPYLNNRAGADKFIVSREHLDDYDSWVYTKEYLADDIKRVIASLGAKTTPAKLERYSVTYWDEVARKEHTEDIRVKHFMFDRKSAKIFGEHNYASLAESQAACERDHVQLANAREINWRRSRHTEYMSGDTQDTFYGFMTPKTEGAYYRLAHSEARGLHVSFHSVEDEIPPRLIRENLPDGQAALDVAQADLETTLKLTAQKGQER